jgi:putative transposase
VRRKKGKRVAEANRQPRETPERANVQWSMDFTSDSLSCGRRFRTLNILDDATRESLGIEVDFCLGGHRVVRVLERLVEQRGLPERLVLDNGPEFRSHAVDALAHENGVELRFIDPGKPIQNCLVESFNGKFRDECLNVHWFFRSLADARTKIEAWRRDYNEVRPHSSLGYLLPAIYAQKLESTFRAEPLEAEPHVPT